MAIGALLRLVAVLKPIEGGDLDRFEALARAMLDGRGYSFTAAESARYLRDAEATPVTELPPGYAVFVAAHYSVWEDRRLLLASNWLMSVAAIALLYFAVRPAGARPAAVAAGLLAVNPWVIRWTGYYLSETFGLFLMSATLWCFTKFRGKRSGLVGSFLVGLFSIALILTNTATLFVVSGLGIYAVWLCRSRAAIGAAMLAGAAILMVPWQIHCVNATGRFQPTILTPSRSTNAASYFHPWVNSWMTSASEIAVYWQPGPFFERIPADVFADAEEKETLRAIAQGFREGTVPFAAYDDAFRKAYLRRVAEVPWWKRRVLFPALRGVTLWTEHQRLLWGEGSTKSIVDAVCHLLNYGYLACFAGFAIAGLRRSPVLVAIVIGGTIGYAAVCGITGSTEYRRNYPFFPALLYLAGVSMPDRPAPKSKGNGPSDADS